MIEKIVSGGQSGVDRAALDFAIERGIPHGGYCPRGRRSETGAIPERYKLTETESRRYTARSKLNVFQSDGTLIVCRGAPKGGTLLTLDCCGRLDRPVFVVDPTSPPDPSAFAAWLRRHGIATLNVAGPRESEAPGIGAETKDLLERLWSLHTESDPAEA
jgi:predicted Rossmann fold nucleotide-binding protein DprA/Smf involved in DNA uptake